MKLLRIFTTLVFIKKKIDKHDLHIDKLYRGSWIRRNILRVFENIIVVVF
jgi:hypothetical protein